MHPRTLWPVERAAELRRCVQRLADLPALRWTFVISDGSDALNYVDPDTRKDFDGMSGHSFVKPATAADWAGLDIIIVTCHSTDLSASIAMLRHNAPQALIALWMWDNHVGHVDNMHCVAAADLYFPSHDYVTDYLLNAASMNGGHVPACSAQWSKENARRLFEASVGQPRDDRLLMNYVDYTWSWRSRLLRTMAEHVPEAHVVTMPADDRRRYFMKSADDRFGEWAGHKSTLILPLDSDLSTRLFDALLVGLVPVVPRTVRDFDTVFPPDVQERLGIVRVDDFEVDTLRAAARRAASLFDEMGEAGARARHDHARERHTIADRFLHILEACRGAGSERFTITYGMLDRQRPALHNTHAVATA